MCLVITLKLETFSLLNYKLLKFLSFEKFQNLNGYIIQKKTKQLAFFFWTCLEIVITHVKKNAYCYLFIKRCTFLKTGILTDILVYL